jgi:dissimilatory sulfite reductase (desulfoviridin) alpha/beta subunit
MCGCTDHGHQAVRDAIRNSKLLTIRTSSSSLEWKTPNGCSSCRPAVNYYLISTWPKEARDDPQSRFINERSHANIQKDGTYSVIPRMWGGETTADELRRIADAVDKYKIPTVKVTGGQRIDLLGVKKEDLQNVWKDIGMPSGHAYAKALRTVKTCVGSEWCRMGTQDSTQMGKDLERAMWRMYAPHKVKFAVSGCPRNCAEAGIKDVGIIGVDSGWEMYIAGNGGIKTEVAHFFVKLKTAAEVLEYTGAFCELYRQEGWYLERTVHYVNRVGLDYVKKRILEDHEGRKALWEQLQFALDGEPDPWFEFDKAAVDTRQFAPLRWPEETAMSNTNEWKVICRVEDIPVLGSRRVARETGAGRGGVPQQRGQGVCAAGPLPAQGRPAEPGHCVRRKRRLPAAQLEHRPVRRLRQGARRRLHAPLSVQGGRRPGVAGRAGARARAPRAAPLPAPQRRMPPHAKPAPPAPTAAWAAASSSNRKATRSPACAATRTTRPTSGGLCTKGSTLHLTASAPVTLQTRLLHPLRALKRGACNPRPSAGTRAGPGRRRSLPHHPQARPRRRGLLCQRPVADRGLLRLQQAGQGPDRHQQHRHQLAPVHEQRGGRLQADAGRRRAARLLRRCEPCAVPVHRGQQHGLGPPHSVSPHRRRQRPPTRP